MATRGSITPRTVVGRRRRGGLALEHFRVVLREVLVHEFDGRLGHGGDELGRHVSIQLLDAVRGEVLLPLLLLLGDVGADAVLGHRRLPLVVRVSGRGRGWLLWEVAHWAAAFVGAGRFSPRPVGYAGRRSLCGVPLRVDGRGCVVVAALFIYRWIVYFAY